MGPVLPVLVPKDVSIAGGQSQGGDAGAVQLSVLVRITQNNIRQSSVLSNSALPYRYGSTSIGIGVSKVCIEKGRR